MKITKQLAINPTTQIIRVKTVVQIFSLSLTEKCKRYLLIVLVDYKSMKALDVKVTVK